MRGSVSCRCLAVAPERPMRNGNSTKRTKRRDPSGETTSRPTSPLDGLSGIRFSQNKNCGTRSWMQFAAPSGKCTRIGITPPAPWVRTQALLRKTANSVGLGVGDVEYRQQLGDLQHFVEFRAQMAKADGCAAS